MGIFPLKRATGWGWGGFAVVLLAASPARALDAEVAANTAAQAYSMRSPFGDPIIYRRRITQTLALGVYNLLEDEKPGGPQLLVKLRMRFDADLGVDQSETGYSRGDATSRYVPGLREAPLDLMYGYVEGRNLAGGWLGFRLGRQYVTDALGWWSFDGGMVRVQTPIVHVEAYGGFEQRAGLPLSIGRYERSGVWRGDRDIVKDAPDVFPTFQQAHLAPAFGAALETAGPHWLHARVDYRRVYNTGSVVTSSFPDANNQFKTTSDTRTSSERVGFAADTTLGDAAAAKGGVIYDFYNQLFSAYYLNLDGFVTQKVTVGADFDYFRPTFDADSIWNWFTHSPVTTATGRVAMAATDQLDLALSGGLRWWETDDDPANHTTLSPDNSGRLLDQGTPADPEASKTTRLRDVLANANGRYRWSKGVATVRGVFETGERGRREGVDVGGERRFSGGQYGVSLRTSLFDWRDDLRPDRSATSFGYVLGGAWRPSPKAEMMLEWEHNMNHLVGQRFRVLALVNLLVTR
jgi:hypothetical protein